MKKISALLLALSLALTLCACSPSGKIPSLEEIVENGEAWSNEQLQQAQGCTLADLEKVWGEADGELPGEYAYFWKADDTTSINVYYHKDAEIEHITITGPEEASGADDEQQTAPAPQPTPMSLAQVGGSDFELSEENAKAILQILDAGSWLPDATDCASDYVLTFDGRTIYYHSDCGTFNERLEQSDQSLRLSDAERETVNRIIQAVIPHDLSPNAPIEISDTDVWPANTFTDDLPVPPGTVSWAAFDEAHQSLTVNLTDMSETDYTDYMESLQQAGFSIIEGTSENIEGQDYTSTGVLLSSGEKNISISYIPGSFTICISFME